MIDLLESIFNAFVFLLGILFIFVGGAAVGEKTTVFNIKNYFDKPYCEQVVIGNQTIKKCWKVVEIK